MEETMYNKIDDRHEIFNIYKSQCARCKRFKEYTCIAFPNGIPDELLTGEKKHEAKIDGQIGDFTFEQ